MSSLNAGKITAGTMVGDRIYGGTIGFNGGSISLGSGGVLSLTANTSINITGGGTGGLFAGGGTAQLTGTNITIGTSGHTYMNGYITINGQLVVNSYTGYTATFNVGPSYPNKTLYFQKGILIYVA